MTQGGKVGQLSLAYGANDMGSVMIEENVVRAAGASYCMDEVEIVRNIEDAGFAAKRRNMHYEILGDPIFRERDVPRMLGARDGARGRRHQRARGAARTIPPAAAPASSSRVISALIRYRARVGCADRRAADQRWLGGGRSRPDRRAGAAGCRRPRQASTTSATWRFCRALVNAHTHLELSYLRDQVPPSGDFVTWIRGVVGAPGGSAPMPKSPEIMRRRRCGHSRSDRVRHGDRRRHQQHAGHVRARWRAARSPASCSTS